MPEKNEETLIAECLEGRTEAFEPLVDRYQKVIFNAVLRMVADYDDAQDITQSAFIKAFENLKRFNLEYKFFSWLYRIAMNESINHLSRAKKRAPAATDLISPTKSPAEQYEADEFSTQVQNAVGTLGIDHRVIIVLRHFADLSMNDLSYILEIPVKTVKSRLYSARQRLCRILVTQGIVTND